jgi:hypothetical protein
VRVGSSPSMPVPIAPRTEGRPNGGIRHPRIASKGGSSRASLPIQRSAWKGNSANYFAMKLSEKGF